MGSYYRLILQSGASMGTEYPLEKNELILGRDASNDLVINDPEVSRRHLRFTLEGSTYRIEDLGSTNGTFIRGQRLSTPFMLNPGDVITLGEKIVLRFESKSTDPNATVIAQRGMNQNNQTIRPMSVNPPASMPYSAPPPAQNFPPPPAASSFPQRSYQPQAPMPIAPPASYAPPKKTSKPLLILLVIAGIIVLFCVIPLIIVDATNSYCTLFPGILNMFITGACP